jgi:hypothetical protein
MRSTVFSTVAVRERWVRCDNFLILRVPESWCPELGAGGSEAIFDLTIYDNMC